jgi:hypothetical protein
MSWHRIPILVMQLYRESLSELSLQGKKQWDAVRKGAGDPRAIQPGDTGIWATCAMKKEAKSVSDLRDLFQEVGSFLNAQAKLHAAQSN